MEYILYTKENNIAYIKLNNPDKLNSFNQKMSFELQSSLDMAQSDEEVRAVLLSGEGRAFSAGQDLAEAISGEFAIDEIVRKHYNPIITKIREHSKPVIAAVNGVAAGAGANIALACDIVIAKESAKFIQAFSGIGLIPDSGGTYTLPRLVGSQRASALMLTGDKISAKEAYEMGMIYKYFSDDTFDDAVDNLTLKISKMPTKAISLTKKLLNQSFSNDLQAQLSLETELQKEASESYDYNEGVEAFLQKRKPEFKGK
jgi:2-(1,2-epoxy-1,2-dihydrophenyl)acetyl-CoA isomerase